MTCARTPSIDRAVLGALPPDALAELRRHAAACEPCRSALEEATYIESLLVGAFRHLDTELQPQREAVLARLDADLAVSGGGSARRRAAGRRSGRASAARPPLARRRGLMVAVYGVAAVLLLLAYSTYATLAHVQREVLARGAQMDVNNLAVALRVYGERSGRLPDSGSSALVAALEQLGRRDGGEAPLHLLPSERLRDGLLVDGFGRPFVYERLAEGRARIYSRGPRGRGTGDTLVAYIDLAPAEDG